MPEYLAPGVFVEETSFRQKTIEGVGTSTAAFVGPTRFGPVTGLPELITSFSDFERIYGGIDPLGTDDVEIDNYLAHGVRAFFENGGRRAYVARVATTASETDEENAVTATETVGGSLVLTARHPGRAGNFSLTITMRLGPNILDPSGAGASIPSLRGASEYDVVWMDNVDGSSGFAYLHDEFDSVNGVWTYELRDAAGAAVGPDSGLLTGTAAADVRVVTIDVEIGRLGQFMDAQLWTDLRLHSEHGNSIQQVFPTASDATRSTELHVPLVVSGVTNGVALATLLVAEAGAVIDLDATATTSLTIAGNAASVMARLAGGTDGLWPDADAYTGDEDDKSGLKAFEDLFDVSIVAAPGSTHAYAGDRIAAVEATVSAIISHCERMQYRIAVIDPPADQLPSQVRAFRGKFDSTHSALYYPWISIYDGVTQRAINVPPSGHVAGIYARNDVERGVHKAPANETIATAVGFERSINTAQQEVLNPIGVNCLRELQGRGRRVWGARTMTSDPEWKYVNLRRYFAFLEASIDRGTQWAVFEPNGERLWANVRRTVEDFLFNEFAQGHLLGAKPEESFFVRCDRSTMTQNDLDNGRLVCLIGVSPLRPAEFVIFRIGQMTLDSIQ